MTIKLEIKCISIKTYINNVRSGKVVKGYNKSNKYTQEEFDTIEERTIEYLIAKESGLIQLVKRGIKEPNEIFEKARLQILKINPEIPSSQLDIISDNLKTRLLGLGKITELIERDDISDIKILAYNNIRIKRHLTNEEYTGGSRTTREQADVCFKNQEEFDRFVNLLATSNKTSLANTKAEQIMTDNLTNNKFILRIAIATGFISATGGNYVHIRKIPKFKRDVQGLIDVNYMTEEEAEYLREAMRQGLSIVICGKGSAGKTTLINALLEELPHNKAGLVIQESQELFSNVHPELMFLNVMPKVSENDIEYTLKTHSVWGLKVDIDLFCIGEITGSESYYYANAAYTGYQVLGSVHAFSARAALPKLVHYAEQDITHMLEDIDIVIYSENFSIKEIVEVSGFNVKTRELSYADIFMEHHKVGESCPKVLRKLKRGW